MSILTSMATAISGLQSNGQSLGIISDNIVNANTTAFKSSRGHFESVLAQDLLGSEGSQLGQGTRMAGVTSVFTQGPINRTDRSTDLAINGNGFFIMKGGKGISYTRDGGFEFDREGFLSNIHGNRVQGYLADQQGRITGKLGDVRLPYKTIPAKSTTNVQVHVNLDARSPVGQPIDLTRPEETNHYTTATQIYDSIGNSHAISLYFNKTGETNWEWYAMTDGAELAGGTTGQMQAVAQGNLIFNEEGKLQTTEQSLINTTFANGAIADQQLSFDWGDAIEAGGTGVRGATQYGTKSGVFRNQQDGYGAGMLVDATVDTEGIITGAYSNGINVVLAQTALARFEATERLTKVGENQFRESRLSGSPLIAKANTNGIGGLMSKSLEASNVDIAHEFVEMIKAQRGFQASAKSITTANEMMDEVINIKRS
ncbi:MAG: flagellar hook protein FlgE [Deltaproteobacteria bacterium]|nr:flagellar hook protein FlgE [Deltaproteobacteria bacterium]